MKGIFKRTKELIGVFVVVMKAGSHCFKSPLKSTEDDKEAIVNLAAAKEKSADVTVEAMMS